MVSSTKSNGSTESGIEKPQPSLLRGAGIVGSLTLISRILGFFRDLLTARLFGTGLLADAFVVAFRIPNLLRSLFAEGALTSAYVPVLSGELTKGSAAARAAVSAVAGFLIITTSLMAIAGLIYAPDIVLLFAPGFALDPEKFELCVLLTRVMLPYIVFVSLVSLIDGTLNSLRIFGTSALAQVAMNIVLIFGAVFAGIYANRTSVLILSWSVVIGGLVQVAFQLPRLKRAGLLVCPTFRLLTPVVGQVTKLMLPAVFGAAIYQLSIFLNTIIASLVSDGAVSWLFYADRIAQLPIGIYSVALSSVLLPMLARSSTANDHKSFGQDLNNALRFTSFIIMPVAALIFQFAFPLTQLLYQRGAFNSESAFRTSQALQGLAVGLWGISCHSVAIRALIARKDTITPTILGLFTLSFSIVFSLLTVGFLGQTSAASTGLAYYVCLLQQHLMAIAPSIAMGHVGLALSTGLASTAAFLILIRIIQGRVAEIDFGPFYASTFRSLAAVLALVAFFRFLPTTSIQGIFGLFIIAPIALILYLFLTRIQNSAEARETFSLFSRLLK